MAGCLTAGSRGELLEQANFRPAVFAGHNGVEGGDALNPEEMHHRHIDIEFDEPNIAVIWPMFRKSLSVSGMPSSMKSGKPFMAEDKDLEEAKRIMARMLSMPPKPHKAESMTGTEKETANRRGEGRGKAKALPQAQGC